MSTVRFYLPDTNVFSIYAKGENRGLSARVEKMRKRLILSSIALAEMEYGWQKSPVVTRRIARQRQFVESMEPWKFDGACARAYGLIKNILWHRLRDARPSGERDMMIAAHALACDAVLVTHNIREFECIPGLEVEDWEKSEDRGK
ncbi:MAG: PIN domain-containing protein [Opitutaceae bacterium]|jgi:tRNA(fMet)-specific endonuclease VapC|nr:PIN domain-containing protein [Opitutaceae bacterium]